MPMIPYKRMTQRRCILLKQAPGSGKQVYLSGIGGMILQDILAVIAWFHTRKLFEGNIK